MSASNQHLALVFLSDAVMASLWQSTDGKTTVLSQTEFAPLESTTLPVINTALDSILDQLGEAGLGIKDCLFCVPNTWTDGDGLRSDRKSILKHVSDDLVLKPLGFVVNSDALAVADRNRTGHSFNGLILFSSDLTITGDYYQDGTLVQSEEVGRNRLEQDISELLARFKERPQKILMIDGANLEDSDRLARVIAATSGLTPERLTRPEMAKAVITAGGSETLAASAPATTSESNDVSIPETEETDFKPPSFLVNNHSEQLAVPEPETAEPVVSTKPKRQLPQFKLPKLTQLSQLKGRRGLMVGALVGLLLLLSGGWLVARATYQATITLVVESQLFEMDETFLLTSQEADLNNATRSALRAAAITESVTLDKEVPTTGSKVIGDVAKGRVTIYNRTAQEKSFPGGTKLSVGKLTFTLDNDVTVASSSAQNDYAPGTAEVNITAEAIGPDSNIDKDTEFTIANFDTSSYVAKNKDPLTGGTSREIQAVSARDIDQAKRDLLQAAQTQLQERFSLMSTSEEPVFFTGVVHLTDESATAEVGAEQKFVGVAITAEGTGAQLIQSDAVEAARRLFTLPEGFTLQEETVELEPIEVTPSGDNFTVRARLRARGVPAVSASEIVESVVGAYIPRAQTQLEENPAFSSVEIALSPRWMAPLFNNLPGMADRISVSLRLEGSP